MNSKKLKNKLSPSDYLDPLNGTDLCEVSKASVEIMLERFCNGKELDFPFTQ